MIFLISEEIAFEKHPIFFHDKNIQQTRNRRDFFNPDQLYLRKNSQLPSHLIVKDNVFSLRSGARQKKIHLLSSLLFGIILEVITSMISLENEM